VLLSFASFAHAQQRDVTADEVNAIAKKLYCPVCENVPLDACPTAACVQWRNEIRLQLEEGQSEEQIIQSFVDRFGDLVVGTPQDPTLRALSLVTPVILGLVAAVGAGLVFMRWQRTSTPQRSAAVANNEQQNDTPVDLTDDDYRARIERDLKERR